MRRYLAALANGWIWAGALVWIAYQTVHGYQARNWPTLVVALAVAVLGELLEVDLRGGRSTPVSNAVIFALFVALPAFEVVTVIVPAFLIGLLVRRNVQLAARFRSSSRRLVAAFAALGTYVWLASVLPAVPIGSHARGVLLSHTIAMVIAASLQLIIDTGASAWLISRSQSIPALPIWKGQLQNRAGLQAAFVSVAALMALAHEVLRESAFLLFLLPLLAARYSFKRYASIHSTYVQTIRALSKVPEVAGYTPIGHSERVSQIATAVARQRGLADNEVQDVEFAALLHDVGRLSLGDPGEEIEAIARQDPKKLSDASAEIIAKTPYLAKVGKIVADQGATLSVSGDLNGPVHLGSRILTIANEYVELTEGNGEALTQEQALVVLESKVGSRYDAPTFEALRRVLQPV